MQIEQREQMIEELVADVINWDMEKLLRIASIERREFLANFADDEELQEEYDDFKENQKVFLNANK